MPKRCPLRSRAREAIAKFDKALPDKIDKFDDSEAAKMTALLDAFGKQHAEALPFAIALLGGDREIRQGAAGQDRQVRRQRGREDDGAARRLRKAACRSAALCDRAARRGSRNSTRRCRTRSTSSTTARPRR